MGHAAPISFTELFPGQPERSLMTPKLINRAFDVLSNRLHPEGAYQA
jgi:hypothetical protein